MTKEIKKNIIWGLVLMVVAVTGFIFYSSRASAINSYSSTLFYGSSNAYVCTSTFGPVSPNVLGNKGVTLSGTTTYSITCSDPDGGYPATAFATVTVIQPPPPVGWIKCNGSLTSCPAPIPWGTSAIISWHSENTTSCSVAPPGWTGTDNQTGNSTGPLFSDTTYNLTCPALDGSTWRSSVLVPISFPPPVTTNVKATEPDYCSSGPAVTVSWNYSDPAGSPQSAYQIQIFNNDTGALFHDTGKIISGSNSYFTGQGILQFNTPYFAQARTWSGFDVPSPFVRMTLCAGPGCNADQTRWKTPKQAYPQTAFTWMANGISENPSPPINKLVSFTDKTVFGKINPANKVSWTFGDGATANNLSPGTTTNHTYTVEGSYYVTLTATDNFSQTCSLTRGPLPIQKPIPFWKEIAPR